MKDRISGIAEARNLVMQLNPVTYDLKPWDGYVGDSSEFRNKAGFIAQEVVDILPGAVGYDEETDRYSLDYSYFIPYLTRTVQEQELQIQEQGERIEELEGRMAEMEQMLELLLSANESANFSTVAKGVRNESETAVEGAVLYQNKPNPFSENTTIPFVLPNDAKSAQIMLFSATGKHMGTYTLPSNQQHGQIMIKGNRLSPGIYTYSLIVDKRIVETKRLVLKE